MSVLLKPVEQRQPAVDKRSPEYLAQLLSDKKQLQVFPNIFLHVEKILDEEINKVRSSLFHLADDSSSLRLPQPCGSIITLTEKLVVPVSEYPDFNFVGRILGPRGMTAKQLEIDTGCKIMVRGKGSMRDKQKEEQNRGKPNWEHLSEELHVLITVEDTENRAQMKLQRATEEVKKLLVPTPDGEDNLKRRQLMELAIINGTYRDTTTSPVAGQTLNPVSVGSIVAAMPLNVSQGPRLIATSPVAVPTMLPSSSMPGGTQYIFTQRLPQLATPSMPTPTVLTSMHPQHQVLQAGDPAATGFLYSYDPYLQQLMEYNPGLEHSAVGAMPKFRRPVTFREHPYAR